MKKNIDNILLICISVAIVIAAVFSVYLLLTASDRRLIRLEIEPEGTYMVSFENLGLIPGEPVGYTLVLEDELSENYHVSLQFVEHEESEEATLKCFTYVTIEVDGETLCHQLLEELFQGEQIDLSVDLSQKKEKKISIRYYMPEDVGNEAQNAEAKFDLLITANSL